MKGPIGNLVNLIIRSKSIVAFTGAGVSTESGISDFRSPGGIWEKYNPSEFTYRKFLNSANNRKKHWKFYQDGVFCFYGNSFFPGAPAAGRKARINVAIRGIIGSRP